MTMRKLALTITPALVLVASSCGGSTAAETAEVESALESTPTTEATTTTTASPIDVDRYCELAMQSDEKSDVFFAGDGPGDPVQFEAFLVDLDADITEAIRVADASIQSELALVKEEVDILAEIAAEYDYDMVAASPALEAVPDSPEREAAQEVVDAYDENVCGIAADGAEDPGEASGDLPTDGGTTITLQDAEFIKALAETPEGMALVVEGFRAELPNLSVEDAECFVKTATAEQFVGFSTLGGADMANLDLSDPAVQGIFELMEVCEIPPESLLP